MAKLLDAGMVVLAERGYHAARVDDVVRRARTSHGTFYLYFANKEDLFRALALECAEEMTALAAGLGPVTPDEVGRLAVREWLAGFVAIYRRYGAVIRAWMEDRAGDRALTGVGMEAFADITRSLVGRVEEAAPNHVDDPELAAAAMVAMVERFVYYVTSRGLAVDDDTMLDVLAGLIHRGFFGAPADKPKSRRRA
jgi:AcrR family transcriptional regulator